MRLHAQGRQVQLPTCPSHKALVEFAVLHLSSSDIKGQSADGFKQSDYAIRTKVQGFGSEALVSLVRSAACWPERHCHSCGRSRHGFRFDSMWQPPLHVQ